MLATMELKFAKAIKEIGCVQHDSTPQEHVSRAIRIETFATSKAILDAMLEKESSLPLIC